MPSEARYDPVRYWNERPNPNRRGQVEFTPSSPIWQYIAPHIADCGRIFELGPGIGRLFGLFAGKRLTTLDLSTAYREQVEAAAAAHEVKVEQLFSDDPSAAFPFADDAFDVAIACQVLIHVPFELIDHTLGELGRVAKWVVVVSSFDTRWAACQHEATEADYCFNHDYLTALTRLGFAVGDIRLEDSTRYFTYGREA